MKGYFFYRTSKKLKKKTMNLPSYQIFFEQNQKNPKISEILENLFASQKLYSSY